ncbi:MAG: T9SS type A sorting domain-containing protein [Chitinivibrionales bacterium]|nr:T9SS type A sorting domain-containing protein [Chitinivibrionales bacterium]
MKRLFFSFSAFCCIFLSFYSNSNAVSGISVCDYNGEIDGIQANIIKDNRWVDSIFLVTTDNRLDARSSQINSYGTHCAFLYNDGGWHVAVATIGGVNKTVKKLCTVPSGGDMGNGKIWSALLEWPRGEWVWFTNSESNNEIYRVNVQTGDRQHVASTSAQSNQFQLSGDAKILIGAYQGDGAWTRLPNADNISSSQTISQWHDYVGGCGHGISPSALYCINNNNGYHSRVAIHNVDTVNMSISQDQTVGVDGNVGAIWMGGDSMWYMWDDWALDSSLINEIYDNDNGIYVGRQQVIGGGNLTLGGWSCNSDHWALMVTGWAPEGRDCSNGANIIGLNFIREQTMPFSHNYCEFDTINNPDGIAYIAWHGDIWISDPVEDIAPGYIDDFNNRDTYTIDGTDTEIDPRMNALWENVGVKDCRGIKINKSSSDGLTLSLSERKNVRIEVYNGLGKLIYSRKIQSQQIRVSRSILHRGVNMITVKDNDGIVFTEKMIKM